jgi:hypothetical protein
MKKLLLVAALAAVGFGGWRLRAHSHHAAVTDGGENKLLVDRLWIDRMPEHERDPINVLALLSDDKLGVFQNLTAYRGSYELFRYERSGGELRVKYPQTGESDKLSVKVTRCDEDGMDFCLDVSGGSRGVRHYYSREEWVIGSLADEQKLADQLDPAH